MTRVRRLVIASIALAAFGVVAYSLLESACRFETRSPRGTAGVAPLGDSRPKTDPSEEKRAWALDWMERGVRDATDARTVIDAILEDQLLRIHCPVESRSLLGDAARVAIRDRVDLEEHAGRLIECYRTAGWHLYFDFTAHWVDAIRESPTDGDLLLGAARFFHEVEPIAARQLIQRAEVSLGSCARTETARARLDERWGPADRWDAYFRSRFEISDFTLSRWKEISLHLDGLGSGVDRSAVLPSEDTSWIYRNSSEVGLHLWEQGEIDEAARVGEKLLGLFRSGLGAGSDPWNTLGHDAHELLGLVAAARGDCEQALEHLVATRGIDPPFTYGSFGPRCFLVMEIALCGSLDAARRHLEFVRREWKSGRDFDSWIELLSVGLVPEMRVPLDPERPRIR